MMIVFVSYLSNWIEYFSFDFLEAWKGAIFVQLRILLLYFLKTDVSSDTHEAFPFSNTGFCNKLRKVLITRTTSEGRLSVNLEECCLLLPFKNFWKIDLYHSRPRSLSNLSGDRFDLIRINEKAFVRVWLFFFQRNTPQIFRKVINKYEFLSIFLIIWNFVIYHVSQVDTSYFIYMVVQYFISFINFLRKFPIKSSMRILLYPSWSFNFKNYLVFTSCDKYSRLSILDPFELFLFQNMGLKIIQWEDLNISVSIDRFVSERR